jgi:acetyltransferase-like isoleucine patch superfamily enzyme
MSVRDVAKAFARLAANGAASPFLLVHALKVPLLGKDRALEGSTQCLSLLPGVCGQYVRRAFLGWTIQNCHPSATVSFGVIFSKTSASIGAYAYIGPYCTLGDATVERDVLIASGVQILSGGRIHGTADPTRPIREQPGEITHVTIGAGSWIGAGAIVMADIGKNSIVGAGAVVTKPVPDSVIAVGVPAKIVGPRFKDQTAPPEG